MERTKEKSNIKRGKGQGIIYYCLLITLLALSLFNISFFFFYGDENRYIKTASFSIPENSYTYVNPLEKQIAFWETFLASHPTYFEGWIELTKLEIKNGNKGGALDALSKASKINPNSDEITFLQKELRN